MFENLMPWEDPLELRSEYVLVVQGARKTVIEAVPLMVAREMVIEGKATVLDRNMICLVEKKGE